ncbi:retrovirus-related pol polyprotein from transposon TNT 1-94 [Tanacetum coccineum]|uniref:Retrovirus-related pol polyprotein from transposon TNT 1-94 n=1 Tax=Tanacetum coccineum TaxID=301880 RepID=A0ABQ5CGC3_9ASTR
MMATVTRNPSANRCYLDSRATVHVCDSRDKFVDYQKVTGKQVIMANNDRADVCGFGTVKLKFTSGKVVTLQNVYHVPSIPKCLISVSKLYEHDDSSGSVGKTQNTSVSVVELSYFETNENYTFSEAMLSRDAPLWKEAINDVMDFILGNQTWELAELPKGVRLVAKGYMHKEGIDYFDTYALVARISSIRTLIAISAIKGLYIHQMDVRTAFLNGYLNEEVYMEQPEGFVIQGQENKKHERIYNVNDMLIIGTTLDGILETKSYLSSNFKMKDLGEVDTILGVRVRRANNQISLSQSHYINKILTKFRHLDIKECNTPFDTSVKLEVNSSRAVAQLEYASAIGSLMYAMHCTRPDIAFAVSKLSQYTSNPSLEHWDAVSRVLEYLKRTSALQLTYTSYPRVLEGYSDASGINHSGDSKSTSWWIYTLAGGAVSWASKKQTCISHSTMEAEFIALAAADKEAEWIQDFKVALSIAYNSVYNGKSRHLHLRYNYVRQLVENGTISVVYVKSCRNLEDPLTKPLTRDLVSVTTRDIALQTRVVATKGLLVWTVYIMKCSARRLQQLYGVLYGDDFGVDSSSSWYSFAAVDS